MFDFRGHAEKNLFATQIETLVAISIQHVYIDDTAVDELII